jgi:hypothetical protein
VTPTLAIVRLPDIASKKGFQQSTDRITPPTAQYTTITENQVQVACFIAIDKSHTFLELAYMYSFFTFRETRNSEKNTRYFLKNCSIFNLD